jgi:hypothetical protein
MAFPALSPPRAASRPLAFGGRRIEKMGGPLATDASSPGHCVLAHTGDPGMLFQ